MKNMKKLAGLLLALVMVFTMTSTAFAAQEGTLTGGSITIDNAVEGQTYSAYQILYLESYDANTNAYSYKANSAWESWLKTQTTYVSIDGNGYVTWVSGADAAVFAKAALEHAKNTEAIEAAATEKATSTTVKFEGLKLGYYLVDSSLGVLCSLDTTNPNVTMEEKNAAPTIEKQVKEDSTNAWGDANTADIGQTVEFKTTIHAKKGAQNYVLHDKMDAGLTLKEDSIKVNVGDNELNKGTDYTVKVTPNTSEESDKCTFEIEFTETYLNSITADTDIVVTYSAELNENAVIADQTNDNKTKLDYGDNSSTEWDTTETKTFKFDIIKTDSNKKLLDGAKFELYTAETGGSKIELVKVENGLYRVATAGDKVSGFTSAVIEAGKVTVKGLDSDSTTTYWLEEIEAPAGYNKLSGRVKVDMTNGVNLETTMTGDTWTEGNGGVQITNNTGTELPSTGGMGTTIFYVVGAILVLGAAVLLITKRRMSTEE